MPPTPISAQFTSHQEPTITVATAMLAGQTVTNYGLGLPLQAPILFFHHQQLYSLLGIVSSAPLNILEFPHNVLCTQSSIDERHTTARLSRTNNGATEHQYCCNSKLAATERIAGAVGASSAGGSAVGSSTRSAGLSCGVHSVPSTVAEDSNFCYEHVFSIHDKTDKQSLALRHPAASAQALLPTPSGSAVARGGSSKKRTHKDAAPPTKRPNLAEHVALERPFACRHCGKRFSRYNEMERHANIHTGERPHKCPICLCTSAWADAMARQEGRCMVIPSLS
ncbi:zinc finger and BTB [Coemansia sp. RSA 922]|nr:zinc finger and BTB [Coemansia sp. RSA 922]